jgi:hypothetical protein
MDNTSQEDAPLTPTFKPIYASFNFKEQLHALAFAGLITERDWSVSVAYDPQRACWQATVRRLIHPVFRDITIWLTILEHFLFR